MAGIQVDCRARLRLGRWLRWAGLPCGGRHRLQRRSARRRLLHRIRCRGACWRRLRRGLTLLRREAVDHVAEPLCAHRQQRERDLKDLLEVVEGCGLPVQPLLIRLPRLARLTHCPRLERLGVLPERVQQPPRVDADDDHEERKRQEQVHRLQHVDHLRFGAAVEVVDVENDAVDTRHWLPSVAGL